MMSEEQYKKEQNKVIWAAIGIWIADIVLWFLIFLLQMFLMELYVSFVWGSSQPGGTLYPLFLSMATLAGL